MSPRKKKWLKRFGYFLLSLVIILIIFWVLFINAIKINPPEIQDKSPLQTERVKVSDDFYYWKN